MIVTKGFLAHHRIWKFRQSQSPSTPSSGKLNPHLLYKSCLGKPIYHLLHAGGMPFYPSNATKITLAGPHRTIRPVYEAEMVSKQTEEEISIDATRQRYAEGTSFRLSRLPASFSPRGEPVRSFLLPSPARSRASVRCG